MIFMVASSKGAGCTIMDAWTPSKTQCSSIRIFPLALPTSSAGVPSTVTVTPASSAIFAAAIPARTDDARQAVVFGADSDIQWTVTRARHECRGQSGHAFFDTESGSVLRLAEPRRGVLLFEPEFGFGVDAMAEV